MAKKKRMTNREKQERAALKRYMQEEGIIPPDKPKLNRKQFIKEAQAEWAARDECSIWDLYLIKAVFCMLGHAEAKSGRISLEAVGAAKILKLAARFYKFEAELKEEGKSKYSADEWYNYIRDILDA